MYDEGATCKREVWSWYSRCSQREWFSLQKTTIYEFMISKYLVRILYSNKYVVISI